MEVLEKEQTDKTNEIPKNIQLPTKSRNKILAKIKTLTNKTFNSTLVILVFIVITTLKTIMFYKHTLFLDVPIQLELIIKTIIFVSSLFYILFILKNRWRFSVGCVISFLVSILLFADELYYSYSSSVISIAQISNLQYTGEISKTLPYLLKPMQLLYFIDFIIIAIMLNAKYLVIYKKKKEQIFVNIACLIVITIVVPSTIKVALLDISEHQFNKRRQIEKGTIYAYHLLDIEHNINLKRNSKYKTKEELMIDYNELKSEYDNKYSYFYDARGIAKDKNVIVLQLEAIQQFVAFKKINGQEITPNLNEFLRENINFTNMYAQSYTTTADSEFSAMNSIYPMENGMSFAQYYSNTYDDIFGIFKQADYTTTFIHGNEGTFWNRQNVYSNMSVDNIIFDDAFPEGTERINEYIADEEVYKYIVEQMKQYDGKYFVNIVAASSHTGFGLDGIQNREQKVNVDVGQYTGTLFGRYLEAVNYADYAFGILIDELKKADLYDDTVILIYGDHYGVSSTNEEMMDFLKKCDHEYNNVELQINFANVLCGMHIPGVSKKKIDTPVSKIDIKPTLTEICGLEEGFAFGVSMFKDKEFVCLNNEVIITDKYCYDGDWHLIETGELLDVSSLELEEQNKLNQYYNYMRRELDMSVSLSVNNLLK